MTPVTFIGQWKQDRADRVERERLARAFRESVQTAPKCPWVCDDLFSDEELATMAKIAKDCPYA